MRHIEYWLLSIGICVLLIAGCTPPQQEPVATRTIVDGQGRSVEVPVDIKKIGTIRAGALRLLCYLDVPEMVAFIERNELKRTTPYIYAYPELKKKEILGAGNNMDPELVAASDADVLIVTYMSEAEADVLQEKSKKPIITLLYGDLGENKKDYYKSLRIVGDLAGKSERAESIIAYTENTISELQRRVQGAAPKEAYIGGIAFNGALGIGSSRAFFPPLNFLNIDAPVNHMDHSVKSAANGNKNIIIDTEQIVDWDTEFMFLDVAGEDIWKNEVTKSIYSTLQTFQKGNTYSILPFNWHTINFENIICNSWFIGCKVYPDRFSDIDPIQKAREVLEFHLGKDIYPEMDSLYRPFRPIKSTL